MPHWDPIEPSLTPDFEEINREILDAITKSLAIPATVVAADSNRSSWWDNMLPTIEVPTDWANSSDYNYDSLLAAKERLDTILGKRDPNALNGTAILNPYMCDMRFVRWRKKHRRSRINKKWQKRYGAIMECKGVAYNLGGTVHACPCIVKALKEQLPDLEVIEDNGYASVVTMFRGLAFSNLEMFSPRMTKVFNTLFQNDIINQSRMRSFQNNALPFRPE